MENKKWGDMSEPPKTDPLRFFGKKSKFAIFSNFADAPVTIGGLEYPTTEHYFQSMKFIVTDPEYAEVIRQAKTPGESKKLGGSRDHPIDPGWADKKGLQGKSIVYMRKALFSKAFQNKKFREALIGTEKREIIEASPYDSYWGEGKDKKGKNMLGKLLMELRNDLQKYKDTMYVGDE